MPAARDHSGYLSEGTIAAIGTAVGGAISMVRISGPRAFEVLAQLAGLRAAQAEARQLVRARLKSRDGTELDDALSVRFVCPESYTGEDVVELHLHGGAFIASRVMEALQREGVRQALPGEFSFRAVRNGKMSLSQAQAVSDLITASNDGAVRLALEKMSGTQNRLVRSLAEDLRQIAVLAEAGIDFADQDISEVSVPQLQKRLDLILENLTRLQSSYDRGSRLQDGIRVAFVGLPNAGKSSFFNALLGEDRSIVSEIPGTTRDVIRERITLRGPKSTLTLRMEDTAGLRITDHPIERIGIERSQQSAKEADLILFVADPSTPPALLQEQWDQLGRPANKTVGIITKKDLFNAAQLSQFHENSRSLGIQNWGEVSSINGAGITASIEMITQFCDHWIRRNEGEVLLTRLDHLEATQEAVEHLKRGLLAQESDLFAADIRQALHALAPLIGETLPDDILGKIFSEFCIGK